MDDKNDIFLVDNPLFLDVWEDEFEIEDYILNKDENNNNKEFDLISYFDDLKEEYKGPRGLPKAFRDFGPLFKIYAILGVSLVPIILIFQIRNFLLLLQGGAIGDQTGGFYDLFLAFDLQQRNAALLDSGLFIIFFLGFTLFGAISLYSWLFFNFNWTLNHDYLFALVKNLKDMDQFDEYLEVEKDFKRIKLKKISINWDIEWVYPFIMKYNPPLLVEIILLTILIPFFLLFGLSGVSLMVIGPTGDSVTDLITILGILSTLLSLIYLIRRIVLSFTLYNKIKREMIEKQKEKLYNLTLQKIDPDTIIMNQNNLIRLSSMQSYPLPSLFRLAPIIPIVASALGTLIVFL